MPTVRYVGPIDVVDVVGVGVLAHGDEADVSADVAASLLDQSDNFESVTKKKG